MTPTLAKIVAFGLFLAMGFSAVPLMLRLFVYGQRRIGNGTVPMVRFSPTTRSAWCWRCGPSSRSGSRSPCPR